MLPETSASPVQLNIRVIDDAAVLRMTVKALLEATRSVTESRWRRTGVMA